MKLTYAQQLQHPNWQRRRLEMLQAAGWCCSKCGCDDKRLDVHHRQYFKGRMAWEYENSELQVLCIDCHESEHETSDWIKTLLVDLDQSEVLAVLGGVFSIDGGPFESRASAENTQLFSLGRIARKLKGVTAEDVEKVNAFIDSLGEIKP